MDPGSMGVFMRALALALCLIATPAMAAEQFDLVCVAKKETVRYRIDLTAGEWCVDKCPAVLKIANVTSGMISLVDKEPQFRTDVRELNQIDRRTGEWTDVSYGGSSTPWERKGVCKVENYSGMPTAKF